MKVAVMSDIHGNLEALRAVYEAVNTLGCDRTFCLGDVVGYGANPEECVKLAESMCDGIVMGNHDEVALESGPTGFNPLAHNAMQWTREQLGSPVRRVMEGFSDSVDHESFELCHGFPGARSTYINTLHAADVAFTRLSRPICFFGHTHHALAYVLSSDNSLYMYDEIDKPLHLKDDCRYLINPGSVGQPRDRDSRASFLTFDDEGGIVSWHRVDYDIDAAAHKIARAGLPRRLATRLYNGA